LISSLRNNVMDQTQTQRNGIGNGNG